MEEKKFGKRWEEFYHAHWFCLVLLIISLAISLYVAVNINQVTDRCSDYWQTEMAIHNCIVPIDTLHQYSNEMNFTNLIIPGVDYRWK